MDTKREFLSSVDPWYWWLNITWLVCFWIFLYASRNSKCKYFSWYVQLETGKQLHSASPGGSMERKSDNGQDKNADLLPLQNVSSAHIVNPPKSIIKFHRRKNLPLLTSSPQEKTQLDSKNSKKVFFKLN